MDGTSQASEPHATSPSVSVELRHGETHISFDQDRPPRVFFDTNVILGLGNKGASTLKRLWVEYGFKFRYSMFNFVELASHLADPPSAKTRHPFKKYQTAFRHLHELFQGVLPSAESILMQEVGLKEHAGPKWVVDGDSVAYQVKLIAEANSLPELLQAGIIPAHYQKLRAIDGKSFLGLIGDARKMIKDPLNDVGPGGRFLKHFQGFLIFRASSGTIRVATLSKEQQLRIISFFNEAGGKMCLSHLVKLVIKAVQDGAKDDANDFYDMLQLLQLRDTNLLFVTDDRVFFQYYVSAEHHRVAPWKGFKDS
jgi:hypothetical protein